MNQRLKLNDQTEINLHKLIESKLLVQANSGGGKSWALRRIIEQAFGQVQIIVLDPEGEFGNMRGAYDFVYCGKGGDAPVESRSAALLARRLLELKASAVIDLYELPMQERKHFVRLFLDAMVNAPKNLWHECIVILDEAHIFAPEKDQSESLGAVADIASRGRKRHFCLIVATQRPAKLNKDVAAECNNKLIGRASLDIDRKRSAEELGFTGRDEILSLRNLEPGEFYCFGPALGRDVEKVKIGSVKVKPETGIQSSKGVPEPTEKVKKILSQLADLPAEAQKEAITIAELKAQITRLKREQHSAQPPKEIIDAAIVRAMKEHEVRFKKREYDIVRSQAKLASLVSKFVKDAESALNVVTVSVDPPTFTIRHVHQQPVVQTSPKAPSIPSDSTDSLSGPEQRILNAIAWMESLGIVEPEQTAIAFLAGYTFGGGGFNNPRGALRTKGYVEYRGDRIALTDEGRSRADKPDADLTSDELHRRVLSVLPGPEQKLLRVLIEMYPNDLAKDELAERTGYAPGSGGFNNPCGRLRTLGLVEYPSAGRVKAKELLFVD